MRTMSLNLQFLANRSPIFSIPIPVSLAKMRRLAVVDPSGSGIHLRVLSNQLHQRTGHLALLSQFQKSELYVPLATAGGAFAHKLVDGRPRSFWRIDWKLKSDLFVAPEDIAAKFPPTASVPDLVSGEREFFYASLCNQSIHR